MDRPQPVSSNFSSCNSGKFNEPSEISRERRDKAEHKGVLRSSSPLRGERSRRGSQVQFGSEATIQFDKEVSSIALDTLKGPHQNSSEQLIAHKKQPMQAGVVYPILKQRLSFVCHENVKQTKAHIIAERQLFFFSTDLQERYEPLCADFGPVNLGVVMRFCDMMDETMQERPDSHLVYYCTNESRIIANTAFLLAAYLVLRKGVSPDTALRPFDSFACMPFRDATFGPATFLLSIRDCLEGIQRAVDLGWLSKDNFDADSYDLNDDSQGGHFHLVCPKFIASTGPISVTRQAALPPEQRTPSHRAAFYAQRFQEHGVGAVVRLNEPSTYDKRAFEKLGMNHHDVEVPACSIPSPAQVKRFLDVCEGEEGMVAVHCQTGLGRTGTMIALWLMKEAKFSARQAIGWLRVVRPGSVIGVQQEYLERMEEVGWKGNSPQTTVLPTPSVKQLGELSEQMKEALRRKMVGLPVQPTTPRSRSASPDQNQLRSGSGSKEPAVYSSRRRAGDVSSNASSSSSFSSRRTIS